MKTKEQIIEILLQDKYRFEFLGLLGCRIRWKDDGAEQDDSIALFPIAEDENDDEYFVYRTTLDDLVQEIKEDSLDFDIIEIY